MELKFTTPEEKKRFSSDVMELICVSISFVCVMRSKIQLPAWNKLFSKPLFVLFEYGILLSALQASLNLHQRCFWRPELM